MSRQERGSIEKIKSKRQSPGYETEDGAATRKPKQRRGKNRDEMFVMPEEMDLHGTEAEVETLPVLPSPEKQSDVEKMEALLGQAEALGRLLESFAKNLDEQEVEINRKLADKENDLKEITDLDLADQHKEQLIAEARKFLEARQGELTSAQKNIKDEESVFLAAHAEAVDSDLSPEAEAVSNRINQQCEAFEKRYDALDGYRGSLIKEAEDRIARMEAAALGSPAERAKAERLGRAREIIGKILEAAEDNLKTIESIDPVKFQGQELVANVYAVSSRKAVGENRELALELKQAEEELGLKTMNSRIAVAVAAKNHEIKAWQEGRLRLEAELASGVELEAIELDSNKIWALEKIAAKEGGHHEFVVGRELLGRNYQKNLGKNNSLVLIGEDGSRISTTPVTRLLRSGHGYILETNNSFYRLTIAEEIEEQAADSPAAAPEGEVVEAAGEAGSLPEGDGVETADIPEEALSLTELLGRKRDELSEVEAMLQERKKRAKKGHGQFKLNREARNKLKLRQKKLAEEIQALEDQAKAEQPPAAVPTPDDLPVIEPVAPTPPAETAAEAPPTPETAAEQRLIEQVRQEVEYIHNLPPAEQRGVIEFIANQGFSLREFKAEKFAKAADSLAFGEKASLKSEKYDSLWSRYVRGLAMTYEQDAARARQIKENRSKGVLTKLAGIGGLGGSLLRTGRVMYDLYDEVGGAVRALNPLRQCTLVALAVGRQFEAGKEARLMNKALIEEKRVQAKDLDRAATEAFELYKKAGLENIKINNPDGSLNQAKLAEVQARMGLAYREHLPEDLKERLGRIDGAGSKILGRMVRPIAATGVELINYRLKRIENNSSLSPEEKSVKKHRLLVRSEKYLRDLDRIISDQGEVDGWAYLAKKAEQTSKGAANLIMIDSVYRLFKHLPELGQWASQWNRVAQDTAEQSAEQPQPAAPQPQDLGPRVAAAGSAGEAVPSQDYFEEDGYGFVGEGERYLRVPGYAEPEPASVTPPVTIDEPRPTPLPATGLVRQETPLSGSESGVAETAVVRRGDGVTRILARQIMAEPAKYGFDGDAADKAALRRFANETATQVAADTGYLDRSTGQEVRLGTSSIGRAAYVLENNNGQLEVHEYLKDQPSSQFASQELNRSGSGFEGAAHEGYEYLHNPGTAGRHGLIDREPAAAPRFNPAPELVDPHLAGTAAVEAAAVQRWQEYGAIVGLDQAGNPLIGETEALRAGINLADGISPQEKAQLSFWAKHRETLPDGGAAKEFFGLADRAKLEYSESLAQSYRAMPEPLKALPGRAAGYLKIFAADNQHVAADGVKEFLGLEADRTLKWSGMERQGGGVTVVKGLSLGQNGNKIDLYISADRVGVRKPTSFLGLGNWDWFRGEWGVTDGRPQAAMSEESLRRLTYRIRHLDALIAKNNEQFEPPAEYPGMKKGIELPPEDEGAPEKK